MKNQELFIELCDIAEEIEEVSEFEVSVRRSKKIIDFIVFNIDSPEYEIVFSYSSFFSREGELKTSIRQAKYFLSTLK